MNKPSAKELPPEEIPEVGEFLQAKEKLEQFKAEYPGLFEELDELVTQYNTALQAAEQAVRGRQVSCGPFNLYQYQTKYDANAFYDAVGKEEFLKMGGSIATVAEYSINKTAFEAYVAQNKIPQNVVQVVVKTSPRYKVPDPLKIP